MGHSPPGPMPYSGEGHRRHPLTRTEMQPSDLAFYTTGELITELLRRKTFLGVIVHSEEELKGRAWTGEKVFQIHFNSNLKAAEACRLLDVVADHMEDRTE